jgi:hypothetical protein
MSTNQPPEEPGKKTPNLKDLIVYTGSPLAAAGAVATVVGKISDGGWAVALLIAGGVGIVLGATWLVLAKKIVLLFCTAGVIVVVLGAFFLGRYVLPSVPAVASPTGGSNLPASGPPTVIGPSLPVASMLDFSPNDTRAYKPFQPSNARPFSVNPAPNVPNVTYVKGSYSNLPQGDELWAVVSLTNSPSRWIQSGPCNINSTWFECRVLVGPADDSQYKCRYWHVNLVLVPPNTVKVWADQIVAQNYVIDKIPNDVMLLDVKTFVRESGTECRANLPTFQ